jgi:hypothetical protein
LSLLFPGLRAWTIFFGVTGVVAAPQLYWVTRGTLLHANSFFQWQPGWAKGSEPLAWFWFKNTGLFIPLLVVALLAPAGWISPRLRRFFLPFMLCFIAPNLFRVAPRVWDNNKVLIYWYVAAAPLVALLLARAWDGNRAARAAVAAAYLSLIGAGVLDGWRVASGTVTITVFDRDATDFARLVRSSTPADAVVLRAPTATHPVLLTGRPSVIGYPSRVRLHGLDPSVRQADNACVYTGCPDARRVLDAYGPGFLVVGPDERSLYSLDKKYLEGFPLVAESGGYQLRRVSREVVSRSVLPVE